MLNIVTTVAVLACLKTNILSKMCIWLYSTKNVISSGRHCTIMYIPPVPLCCPFQIHGVLRRTFLKYSGRRRRSLSLSFPPFAHKMSLSPLSFHFLVGRFPRWLSEIQAVFCRSKYFMTSTRAIVSSVTMFCQKFSWQFHRQVDHTTAAVQPGKKKNCERNFWENLNRTSLTEVTAGPCTLCPTKCFLTISGPEFHIVPNDVERRCMGFFLYFLSISSSSQILFERQHKHKWKDDDEECGTRRLPDIVVRLGARNCDVSAFTQSCSTLPKSGYMKWNLWK